MENPAYPQLKEPESMSQMMSNQMPQEVPQQIPHQVPQQMPQYFPIENPTNLEFKIKWGQIFNWILIVGEILLLWNIGYYLGTVQDMEIYLYLEIYQVVLIIMNIVWYFYRDETFVYILTMLTYGTFIIFFAGVIAVILLISGSISELVGVLVPMLFIVLPLVLLGLSLWIVLKNNKLSEFTPMQYSTIPLTFDQEAQKMEKFQQPANFKMIPVMLQPGMQSQFVKILQ